MSQPICEPVVDEFGHWGRVDWPYTPQLYDPCSPWLAYIPIHNQTTHVLRLKVVRDMFEDEARETTGRKPINIIMKPRVRQNMQPFILSLLADAERSLDKCIARNDITDQDKIVWPGVTIARAKYLNGQLISGVTSKRGAVIGMVALQRLLLELQGFCIWASMMEFDSGERFARADSHSRTRGLKYRGVFLHGSVADWLDPTSLVRRVHAHLSNSGHPVYTLLNAKDWDTRPAEILNRQALPFNSGPPVIDREKPVFDWWVYPPRVSPQMFERAARGLRQHNLEGQQGQMHALQSLAMQRDIAQAQQSGSSSSPWTAAVKQNNRPSKQWQSRQSARPPPDWMPYFLSSSMARMTWPPNVLDPDQAKGTLLPLPTFIWNKEPESRDKEEKMLVTLAATWKLLVMRPVLLAQGFLTVDEAFLDPQRWKDILTREKAHQGLEMRGAIWPNGKVELWGQKLLPAVLDRQKHHNREPTLQRMLCSLTCRMDHRFTTKNDPDRRLAHFVLFQLAEMHILHDFASYHPDLNLVIGGRWCPPAFDALDAYNSSLDGFAGVDINFPPTQVTAMNEILSVVRWDGRDGPRGWELPVGSEEHKAWLTALRDLLDKSPCAWIDNRVFDSISQKFPIVDLRNCAITGYDVPFGEMQHLLVETHILLSLRAHRIPWPWFNKPEITSFRECSHQGLY